VEVDTAVTVSLSRAGFIHSGPHPWCLEGEGTETGLVGIREKLDGAHLESVVASK
jgi:hypothetical protein